MYKYLIVCSEGGGYASAGSAIICAWVTAAGPAMIGTAAPAAAAGDGARVPRSVDRDRYTGKRGGKSPHYLRVLCEVH